ncbi:HTH-type transcriptional activator RhaR [Paenibacillus allorhizoplanae]|uniref:HTH-type transcriptional activator RhaR n=1 Tax=Paenibacillus allorhizoplanae TaxID=2905648 RepID=A0ABN8GBY6_9BACL|nr:helix-turn-helix domain-containing protein [Paenibacillus allorhizoplanae]CAH1202189.1 HTH-type transcriptional activator RhaR [Paenibacillus allorhizoplanae]
MVTINTRTSIFNQLLISFVVIITSLILVLSSLLYYNYTSSSINMLKEMKTDILSKTSYSAIYMDTLAKKFCQTLSLNNPLIAFANSNEEDILITSKAIQTLSSLAIPNTYIHSAYIYNRKIDTMIATPSDTFYNSADFYDKEITQWLGSLPNIKNLPTLYPISRKIKANAEANSNLVNVYTYILFDVSDYRENYSNAIILNVDADWLRMTLSSIDKNMSRDGSELFVVNENGSIVSHSSPEMFMKNIADLSYFKEMSASAASSGTIFDNFEGEKHVISYVSSNELGWKFVSITPYNAVFASVKRNRTITVTFCALILLLGLFYAFLASKKLYRPIGQLTSGIKNRLHSNNKSEKFVDEVGFLASAFSGMLDKTDSLESMKRNSMPVLKNEYLKHVLSSSNLVLPNHISHTDKDLDITVKFTEPLFLFMLKIDGYNNFILKHSEKDRSLYKYAIANIAKEFTADHYGNEVIDSAADELIVLANISNSEADSSTLYHTFHDIVESIQHYVAKHLNISISGTLGYVINSPEQIKSLYEETVSLALYRIRFGHASILSPEILKEVDSERFTFPTTKEKQLIDALKLGNGKASKEAYKEIIRLIERSTYDNIITSIIYLFYAIYNELNRIAEGTQAKMNIISIDFLHKVTGLETLDEMEETFFSLIDDIVLLKEGAKDHKKDEIVKSVMTLIHASYQDKNLTLISCAETLAISSVYLGKLFKNATGKSVAEYITVVRMEKLKHYLEHSQLPIIDILEKCGMEKSNYFYTSFKKHFGVSLTEYRLNGVKIKSD